MSSEEENDSLSDLLNSVAFTPVDPQRREAIFAQTRGVLRRRRLVRRVTSISVLAACYVVGVLSVLCWQSVHSRNKLVNLPEIAIENPSKTSSAGESSLPSEQQPAHIDSETPNAIAHSKPDDALSIFEKLRRAGDRQLNVRGNLQGAIGCYRRALDFASDDDLQIVPERDSWLLISLKEALLEARKHVHKKS